MIKAKKELGQNFLKDSKSIENMIKALDLKKKENVIEIGPGTGAVTEKLIKKIAILEGKLVALEIDERCIYYLNNKFSNYIDQSVLKIFDIDVLKFFKDFAPTEKFKVISSVPYYITSPILHALCYAEVLPKNAVLLIQKEVAQKVAEVSPKASYLSTFVQTFYDIEYIVTVEKKFFEPIPKVDGGIIKLTKKVHQSINQDKKRKYEGFLHKAFSNPRKMLNKVFTEAEIKQANINPKLRPQNLTVEDWINIFQKLGM